MRDGIDEALQIVHQTGPEYGPGASNHAPMAIEAMTAMERGDGIIPWLENYRAELDEAPRSVAPIAPDQWREALADPTRVADWVAFFDREIAELGWQAAVAPLGPPPRARADLPRRPRTAPHRPRRPQPVPRRNSAAPPRARPRPGLLGLHLANPARRARRARRSPPAVRGGAGRPAFAPARLRQPGPDLADNAAHARAAQLRRYRQSRRPRRKRIGVSLRSHPNSRPLVSQRPHRPLRVRTRRYRAQRPPLHRAVSVGRQRAPGRPLRLAGLRRNVRLVHARRTDPSARSRN